jgi:hypothetical protein
MERSVAATTELLAEWERRGDVPEVDPPPGEESSEAGALTKRTILTSSSSTIVARQQTRARWVRTVPQNHVLNLFASYLAPPEYHLA